MDSLTQIVLGAAVGEAVLGRKVGNKAMIYGAIAGTIPDLDTFASYFTDVVSALEIHRGFTHSIFFSLVFAPIFGWLIYKVEKKAAATWKDWSLLMFWGLFTHPMLDAHTTWGTQLLWPLDLRLAYKNIFVIDPLYTLPFLFFLIWALRSQKGSEKRRKRNNLGLIVSSVYMLITLGLKAYTFIKFEDSLISRNIPYKQIETKPSPFNTILWTANVELEDSYLIGDYSIFDTQPISYSKHPKNHEILGDLVKEEQLLRLIDITNGWYIITQKEETLFFNDLRFGVLDPTAEEPEFVFSYSLNETDTGLDIQKVDRKPAEAKKILKGLITRIQGN
jgi:inner membrane protein